jgi:hypothetical protein
MTDSTVVNVALFLIETMPNIQNCMPVT